MEDVKKSNISYILDLCQLVMTKFPLFYSEPFFLQRRQGVKLDVSITITLGKISHFVGTVSMEIQEERTR